MSIVQLAAWGIFILAVIGLALPVLISRKLDGWQKEVAATLMIFGVSLIVAGLSTMIFKSDFMVILTRTVIFEGLPYGFALRNINLKKATTV